MMLYDAAVILIGGGSILGMSRQLSKAAKAGKLHVVGIVTKPQSPEGNSCLQHNKKQQ